jgi:hypothetical protein
MANIPPTRSTEEHWLARAREARAEAALRSAGSKERQAILAIAANYERLAQAAARREVAERRQTEAAPIAARCHTPDIVTGADRLLLRAEEYRAIADSMAGSAARGSFERLAQDCERRAARAVATATRTPEHCIGMAKECDEFAATLPLTVQGPVRLVADRWRALAQEMPQHRRRAPNE